MQPHIGPSQTLGRNTEFDMAIVGVERAAEALRGGWKGRPLVAAGPKDSLPLNLQPLVVSVGLPVSHARLANALVKSTVLLKWGHNAQGPKLGKPIPSDTIKVCTSPYTQRRILKQPDLNLGAIVVNVT